MNAFSRGCGTAPSPASRGAELTVTRLARSSVLAAVLAAAASCAPPLAAAGPQPVTPGPAHVRTARLAVRTPPAGHRELGFVQPVAPPAGAGAGGGPVWWAVGGLGLVLAASSAALAVRGTRATRRRAGAGRR
ncbi:hypothetical protein [Amycolatopsis sp. lyj-23]|uniref:hypothetical protein n=1 Tax=Amycolatopsis sp. lyj-23 TaxID=2789283 RepID=UPI00397C175F